MSYSTPPIWLLSTKGRPDACQEVLDACEEMGMSSRGVVYVDESVGSYSGLVLPRNWTIHCDPTWGGLHASMEWCFEHYPDASQYGWLADDTVPRTHHFERLLESAAGSFNLAYANDLWLSDLEGPEKGLDLTSGLCWGGDLVRTVGWWALPGVVQAGIDTAWLDIVRPLGLYRYLKNVVVEHKNWRTGKREFDETDRWDRCEIDYISEDLKVKLQWESSNEYRNAMRRVMEATNTSIPAEKPISRRQKDEGVSSHPDPEPPRLPQARSKERPGPDV